MSEMARTGFYSRTTTHNGAEADDELIVREILAILRRNDTDFLRTAFFKISALEKVWYQMRR